MEEYINIFFKAYHDYWNYLAEEVSIPSFHNYFYWLLSLSLLAWGLEIIFPWRKNQAIIRKDFWLDALYMFFNFFLFALIIHRGLSDVFVELFSDFLSLFGAENIVAFHIEKWPIWAKLSVMFVLADFIQWNIHRLLHRVNWLWEFHKVHHSVKEMGFAAHFRFHWMEAIIYKTLQYLPLALIGFGLDDFFIIYIIAIAIGHLNHSNLNWNYGPLKYIFNNPKMHIWHHAKKLPENHRYGVNFGLSLSVWDYLFKTAYIPHSGRDVELGFDEDEKFPAHFPDQIIYPLNKKP